MSQMDVARLLNRIDQLPMFGNCGKTSSAEIRLDSWGDWAGPEDPCAMELSMRMQALHDELIAPSEERSWNELLQAVVGRLRRLVPYVDGEDAFYAPNIAVWEAAWVFALEEVFTSKGRALPAELSAQIQWYSAGHWPCALTTLDGGCAVEDYVVF